MDDALLGVVLCGGQSRRMGHDKGLILREGRCWAAWMGRKLAPLPVVYSIREAQEAAYSAAMPGVCFVIDSTGAVGPLNGLFSVHAVFPGKDLLLLGCDMQDMDAETIGDLRSVYRSDPGVECYAYRDGDFVQPLCGIYTAKGLRRVGKQLGDDRSLRGLLRRMRLRSLEVKRGEAFANYNSERGEK